MNYFLAIALYVVAGWVALGLIPPALLAAKDRKPVLAVLALLIAALLIYSLVMAGTELLR